MVSFWVWLEKTFESWDAIVCIPFIYSVRDQLLYIVWIPGLKITMVGGVGDKVFRLMVSAVFSSG